jgi:3-deoxy-manno-octulosonate cytidylyltransferase (CMP-KDO synthetase)
MRKIIVIPARYASTRLPGKPLIDIQGKPMIQRVYEQAAGSAIEEVIVATDDVRIEDCLKTLNYNVCMTKADHPSGTDRLAEVADILALDAEDIIINVQGDEPLIPHAVIEQVAGLLEANPEASVATLSTPITDPDTLQNSNVVKVVSSKSGRALYFSRAPIAWHRDSNNHQDVNNLDAFPYQRHIGIYAYRAGFLRAYANWAPCALEQTESLEQLRALFNDHIIQVAEACEQVPEGIDTADDLAAIRNLLAE